MTLLSGSRRRLWLAALIAGACASAPPTAEEPEPPGESPTVRAAEAAAQARKPAADGGADAAPARPAFDPNKGLETTHVTEKAWLQAVREKIGTKLKVEPGELRFSAAKQWATFVRTPPPPVPPKRPPRRPRPPPPRRHEIFVVDMEGRVHARFRPVTLKGSDEPPRDLRFLSEDRLVYEVVGPPPETGNGAKNGKNGNGKNGKNGKARGKAAKRAGKRGRARAKPAAPPAPDPWVGLPRRLFIVQPFVPPKGRKARPIRCEGVHFDFTAKREHFAYVTGKPDAAFVAVDGEQVYPRKGRTVVASNVSWSRDGRSLAFLESRPDGSTHLMLLAEFDNPTGDISWPLPSSLKLDGAQVFWDGSRKLVVGKTLGRPLFSTKFEKQSPKEFSP